MSHTDAPLPAESREKAAIVLAVLALVYLILIWHGLRTRRYALARAAGFAAGTIHGANEHIRHYHLER